MHIVKVSSNELSPEDLRTMVASQSKIVALTEQVERARNNKSNADVPFCERFFHQVKHILA